MELEELLLKNAKKEFKTVRFPTNRINRNLRYAYVGFVIFSVIVDLPQEHLYFSEKYKLYEYIKSQKLAFFLETTVAIFESWTHC